ncbi:MAG: carboxypeptidase regulatory-like domain-containing protein [Acidobacteria bacterium]|nr:carboxypeptidase regulatory-like domain-containing protein [Acidobacteriota bacterium]
MKFLLALFLAAAALLPAQSTFGEIRGTVSDPTGAVIAGANVETKNTGTGETRKAASDAAGNYAFLNLDAGTYEVTVESAGFRKRVVQNVILRAREVARVDTQLDLASAATEVQVTTAQQVITTDIATIVDSKTSAQILSLPVNFRAGGTNSVFSAISFTPGVQPDSGGGSIGIAGGMPFQATATIDGISSINVRNNGIINEMFPSAESIDEIKVSSVSNNAEFAQIGDVTTTSKGGTNNYHGSLFWYHQNGAMDARDFFSSRVGAPFKISNDYGVSMGGPVRKNKTFLFGTWEQLKYRAQAQFNVITIPDAYRTGNLSSVTRAVTDPLGAAGAVFAGNIIPASRQSSVSAKVMDALYPRQNQPGDQVASPNLRFQASAKNNNNQYDLRGDHLFNERHNIFVRYSNKNVAQISPIAIAALGEGRENLKSRTMTAAYNAVLRTTLVNEFRFGFADRPRTVDFGPNGTSFDGPALVKTLGINGLRPDPPKVASVPDFGITGFLGTARARGFTQLSKNVQFTDNLTWTKGKHTFKFGVDLKRLRATDNISFFSGDDLGEYRFNGMWTGNAFADFLLGIPQRNRVANTSPDIDGSATHAAGFAQDDWKVNHKLTLNYGVRYEIQQPFWDRTLQLANFDRDYPGGRVVVPNKDSLALTAAPFRASIGNTPIVTAAEAGIPERLRYTDTNNVMPRIGFAYRPWGNRTVIRGGYGIYSVTILGAVFYSLTGIHTSDTRTFTNTLVNGRPELIFPNAFGTGLGVIGAVGTADFRRATQFDSPAPYAQQWNLTIERDLGWNTGLRLTYQGSHSIKMYSSPDLNQVRPNTIGYAAARPGRPYPNWAIVYSRDNGVSSKYNAMIVEVNRRFAKGLGFQTSWAWTKNLSNSTGSNSTGFASEAGSVPTDRFNLGLDYGNVSPSRRHRWLTLFNYDLPYGADGKTGSGAERVTKLLAGGWQLSGILVFQSGPFLTPITGGRTDPSGTNVDSRANDRPDYASNVADYGNKPKAQRNIDAWFDSTAFTLPANNIGRFGLVGPGQLVGPGTQTVSAKLQKRFYIKEGFYTQMEGSFTNLLNHANFGIPALTSTAANFGRITSTQGAEFGSGRTIQVGIRVVF